MSEHSKFSYSFSFSKQTCDNLRYYKKTNENHEINKVSEKFILFFIKKSTKIHPPKRGRPHTKKDVKDVYIPFSFSFLKSTIEAIKEYKKSSKDSLDAALENHLNLQIPVRQV